MKRPATLLLLFIGICFNVQATRSIASTPDNPLNLFTAIADGHPFILEENPLGFNPMNDPGFYLKESFSKKRLHYSLRFVNEYEMTPAKFNELRDTYYKYSPNEEFEKAEFLMDKSTKNVSEIRMTFGIILPNQQIDVRGQMIISFVLEKETRHPLVSDIAFKSPSTIGLIDKNQILALYAANEKQRKELEAFPPPPQFPEDEKPMDIPTTAWKIYPLGATDMTIKFPIKPEQQTTNVTNDVHQYTGKLYTEDANGFSFTYLTSILKADNRSTIDSVTFRKAITNFTTMMGQTYKFGALKEEDVSFKNCRARSTRANVKIDNGGDFKYYGLSITRKNYIIFMQVLTTQNYLDFDGRIPYFFNSLSWKE